MLRVSRGFAFSAALFASGCSLGPLSVDESCPASRRSATGECCASWSVAVGAACAQREWTLPTEADALGDSDVRSLYVAVDGRGVPIATWVEVTASTGVVRVAEPSSAGFEVRSPNADFAGVAVQTDVAAGPEGEALIAWKQQYPGDQARVFVSEREPDGTWRDPASDDDAFSRLPTAYEPRPRIFANGERLVVWNQWMSTGYGVAVANKPPGQDWHLPADADDVLSRHIYYSNAPQPAVNARGDALITWYQSDGASLLAWESERFGYEGAFSHPGPEDYLSDRGAPIDSHAIANPKPALSPEGDAAVAWTQENGKGSTLVYLATRTKEGQWTRPADLDDALSPRLGYARCVQLAFAPEGDLFVTWYQDTGNGNRVYAAHRAAGGEWIEPGREPTLLSTEGAEALYPALAIGEDGSTLVAWTERREDRWVVVARRRGAAGATWGPIETLSIQGSGDATQPVAAIGGPEETAIVGWSQQTSGVERAYLATIPAP